MLPLAPPRRAAQLALLALLAAALCCAADAQTNSSNMTTNTHNYGTVKNDTVCKEWHPDTIAKIKAMAAPANVLENTQREDLKAFREHHRLELKHSKSNAEQTDILTTGPCGALDKLIMDKLKISPATAVNTNTGARKTPGHSVAALLSLLALARLGATF